MGMMGSYGGGMGSLGLFGGLLGTLLLLGLLAGLVFLSIWLWRMFSATVENRSWAQPQSSRQLTAREILQTRYARGELSREEYQTMLQDLS